jgi:hypothetical protein
VSETAQLRRTLDFESAMLTRKKLSIEGIGSVPFDEKMRVFAALRAETGACHNTGVANTNRMPA